MTCPVRVAAEVRGDAPALSFGDRRWTWREVDVEVSRWTAAFAAYGVRAGDRVGLLSANVPELVFAFFGALRGGASCVLFNARSTAAELAPLIERAGCFVVVGDVGRGAELSFERLVQAFGAPERREPCSVGAVATDLPVGEGERSGVPLGGAATPGREAPRQPTLEVIAAGEVGTRSPDLPAQGRGGRAGTAAEALVEDSSSASGEPRRAETCVTCLGSAGTTNISGLPAEGGVARAGASAGEFGDGLAIGVTSARAGDVASEELLSRHAAPAADLESSAGSSSEDSAHAADARIAVLLFTSGTTAQPRLIELTHGNLIASARATALTLGGESSQRWLGTLPLFHVGGLAMLYRCAVLGASLQLEPGFDVARTCEALDSGAITHVSLVPTTLRRVLDHRPGHRFSPGVRAILVGGGPMGPALLARARAVGLPVLQTYGLTEACSQVCTERLGEADGTTSGLPLPGLEVRVVGEGGALCPPDVVGEILVRGPTVAPALGPWLATKDLGSLDARGRLTIWSRRADLIVTGGENVSPAELEGVLAADPSVLELCVVPLADDVWGQVPIACVVPTASFDPQTFLRSATARLAGFKRLRGVVVADALPRNAGGKVLRSDVRAWVEAHASSIVLPVRS